MACNPTISDGLADGSVFRKFEHQTSQDVLNGNMVESSQTEPFRDGDIIYAVSFGQKLDKTKIIYIVPTSEKPNQSVYISKVTLITPTFTLATEVNDEYVLTKQENGRYVHDIRIMEDVDFTKIPMDTKSISIELDYKVDEVQKQIVFELPAIFYQAPIH